MSERVTVHAKIAEAIGNPRTVWCRTCGRSEPIDAADCLAHGWPKCHGYTMTLDAPATPSEQPSEKP